MQAMPDIDLSLCDGCGHCVTACHGGGVVLAGGKAKIMESKVCDYCAVCEAVCPRQAITCSYIIVPSPEDPH